MYSTAPQYDSDAAIASTPMPSGLSSKPTRHAIAVPADVANLNSIGSAKAPLTSLSSTQGIPDVVSETRTDGFREESPDEDEGKQPILDVSKEHSRAVHPLDESQITATRLLSELTQDSQSSNTNGPVQNGNNLEHESKSVSLHGDDLQTQGEKFDPRGYSPNSEVLLEAATPSTQNQTRQQRDLSVETVAATPSTQNRTRQHGDLSVETVTTITRSLSPKSGETTQPVVGPGASSSNSSVRVTESLNSPAVSPGDGVVWWFQHVYEAGPNSDKKVPNNDDTIELVSHSTDLFQLLNSACGFEFQLTTRVAGSAKAMSEAPL